MKNRLGFSLTEMIVALALFGIVGSAAFAFLISQNRYYDTGERVQMAQQEARGTVRLVTDELRRAGGGVNTLSVSDPDIIVPNDGSVAPDVFSSTAIQLLSVDQAMAHVPLSPGGNNGQRNRVFVWVPDTVDLGPLQEGNVMYIQDSNSGNSQVVRVTKITDIGDGRIRIEHINDPLQVDYPPGSSFVWLANDVAFRLAETNGDRRVERRFSTAPWETIAENVTDLTVRYFDQAGTEIMPNSSALRRTIRRVEVAVTVTVPGSNATGGRSVDFVYRASVSPRNLAGVS